VVEDAAEAHLARYRGRPVGSLGTLATFSFYGNKIFTSGEGGALTLDDPDLERRIRMLRGQGMDPDRRYFFPITGYNYRLTNVACALLCAQLERREQIIARRRSIFDRYRSLLAGAPGIGLQPVAEWAEPAHWLFCITVDEGKYGRSRDDLATFLDAHGVETRPFFLPLHRLPPFERTSRERGDTLPVTDLLASRGLNLPTFTSISDEDLDRVSSLVLRGRR
jgi:perosamine synthetase